MVRRIYVILSLVVTILCSGRLWAQTSIVASPVQANSGERAEIGDIQIEVAFGDALFLQPANAIILPHFESSLNWGGAAWGMIGRGAQSEMVDAEAYFENLQLALGDVFITESKKLNRKIIHAMALSRKPAHEFFGVQRSTINALSAAVNQNLVSVAIPVVGAGVMGSLSIEQMAQAIFSAVKIHSASEQRIKQFFVSFYGQQKAYDEFVQVLQSGSYKDIAMVAKPATGTTCGGSLVP